MQALKKPLFLVLVVALSCEIEDEYSNPDRSEHLGTKIYTTNNPPAALLWSENTNEIIVVGFDGIAAIEATSKKVRKLPIAASNFPTQTAWVVGNTIYQLNSNGELSRVDLTNLSFIGNLVDSASFNPFSSPFTATHFAYAKYNPTDYLNFYLSLRFKISQGNLRWYRRYLMCFLLMGNNWSFPTTSIFLSTTLQQRR